MRSTRNALVVALLAGLAGCESQDGGVVRRDGAVASGGRSGQGGTVLGSGGASASDGTGGAKGSGGATVESGTGGRQGSDGSVRPDGGVGTGGRTGTDASVATGGSVDGGTGVGGGTTSTSGRGGAGGSGGRGTGGAVTGTGGRLGSGGTTSAGGAPGSGGSTGPCTPTWEAPPANVAAWIAESWNAQLGSNIKSRKAWLIDNVMKGQGLINLCVRWGASTAPSTDVKKNMAASAEKWFNDWFAKLAGYGCFPIGQITAKVTGWAVKPGNESWVADLDSSIKVYTDTDSSTDPPGEPMCPSACSFFDNWSHSFPKCPGGDAFHTDYWMWLDDKIPGSGAAAVGGDWGLRMPVSGFIAAMGKSDSVIEHEMGHGFGFQDYYDWTGSKPNGGSLMIVGSTSSSTPTIADQWLLRRTWQEMKGQRGW